MNNSDEFPYTFTATACQSCKGQCCRGETGYVWLNNQELSNLASALKMHLPAFTQMYIRSVQGRSSLREFKFNEEHVCCFFDLEKSQCSVYEQRPQQCRQFPFWDEFKDNIEPLLDECLGVDSKAAN